MSKPKPREVEVVHPSYQPSKAELEEDMRVKATFDEAVKALTRPVSISHYPASEAVALSVALTGLSEGRFHSIPWSLKKADRNSTAR